MCTFHDNFLIFGGVELRHFFPFKMLMVSGLCNLYCQHFPFLHIQTLHIDCSHIEDVQLPFSAHLIDIFSLLRGVELRTFLHPKCLGGIWFV